MNEEQKTEAFINDETVPFETIVYYSKKEAISLIKSFTFVIILAFAIILIISIFSIDFAILASIPLIPLAILCFFILYDYYNNYQKAIRKEPQITMNEDGIQIVNMKFYPWNRIQVSVDKDNFAYNYGTKKQELSISSCDKNAAELEKLLQVYRWRFKEKKPQIDMNEIETEAVIDINNAFVDYENVPFETQICYSKADAIFSMKFSASLIIIAFIILLVIELFTVGFLIPASIVLVPLALSFVYALYSSYDNYNKAIRKEAQIIMNEDGIKIVNMKFYPWNRIQVSVDKNKFAYNYGTKKQELSISSYDKNRTELEKLLQVYRWRFKEKNPQADMNEIEIEIQEAIEKANAFVDDENVPFETQIYYSKSLVGIIISTIFILFFGGLVIIMLFKGAIHGILLLVFPAIFLWLLYDSYKIYQKAVRKEPQITLNEQGMQIKEETFFAWTDIDMVEVVEEKEKKTTSQYFIYQHIDDIHIGKWFWDISVCREQMKFLTYK